MPYSIDELNSAFEVLINKKKHSNRMLPIGIDGTSQNKFLENRIFNLREIERSLFSYQNKTNKNVLGALYRLSKIKKSGGFRYLFIPRIRDQIIFKCIQIELTTILQLSQNISANSPHNCITRFHDQLKKYKNPWIIRTDISNFYDSVDRQLLRCDLEALGIRKDLKSFLDSWLNKIFYRDANNNINIELKHGLPQGISISSTLAEIYMKSVDINFGINYFRYIDDIVIIAGDRAQAFEELTKLQNILEQKKLSISMKKTQVLPIDSGVEWLGLVHFKGSIMANTDKYDQWKRGFVRLIHDFRKDLNCRNNISKIEIKKLLFSNTQSYIEGEKSRRLYWFSLIEDVGQWKKFDSFIHGQLKFFLKYYKLEIENTDALPSIQLSLLRLKNRMKSPIAD